LSGERVYIGYELLHQTMMCSVHVYPALHVVYILRYKYKYQYKYKVHIYRIFPNLIRTRIQSALVFADFLNEKKSVRGSNPHLSFHRPLPTKQTDWIILDVPNALTVIRLTRRVWSRDWVTDNDSVMSDDGESDE
jgi:hypothetical protein